MMMDGCDEGKQKNCTSRANRQQLSSPCLHEQPQYIMTIYTESISVGLQTLVLRHCLVNSSVRPPVV